MFFCYIVRCFLGRSLPLLTTNVVGALRGGLVGDMRDVLLIVPNIRCPVFGVSWALLSPHLATARRMFHALDR